MLDELNTEKQAGKSNARQVSASSQAALDTKGEVAAIPVKHQAMESSSSEEKEQGDGKSRAIADQENAKPSVATTPEESEDTRFDFGGLPDRNLKKNLGCG